MKTKKVFVQEMASINNFLNSVNQKNTVYYAHLLFLGSNTFEQLSTSINLQYFTSAVLSDSSVSLLHFNKHRVLNIFLLLKVSEWQYVHLFADINISFCVLMSWAFSRFHAILTIYVSNPLMPSCSHYC